MGLLFRAFDRARSLWRDLGSMAQENQDLRFRLDSLLRASQRMQSERDAWCDRHALACSSAHAAQSAMCLEIARLSRELAASHRRHADDLEPIDGARAVVLRESAAKAEANATWFDQRLAKATGEAAHES